MSERFVTRHLGVSRSPSSFVRGRISIDSQRFAFQCNPRSSGTSASWVPNHYEVQPHHGFGGMVLGPIGDQISIWNPAPQLAHQAITSFLDLWVEKSSTSEGEITRGGSCYVT
jgi:hypothetical protein